MPSFLEKLYLFITADASGVKKETESAKTSVDALTNSLKRTAVFDKAIGSQFGAMLGSLRNTLASFFAAKSLISGVFSLASEQAGIEKLSETLNANVEDVSAWSRAVRLAGGSQEQFQSSVQSIGDDLTQLAVTGRSRLLPFYQALGVRLTDTNGKFKNVIELLPEFADSFAKLSGQQAFSIGKRIGLDEETIRLLRRGRVAVDELIRKQKELGVTTKEDTVRAQKFYSAWRQLKEIFEVSRNSISSRLIPVFTKLFEGVRKVYDYISAHSDLVKGAFIGIGAVITAYLLPPLLRASAAMFRLLLPAIALAGVIAIFAIAFEDLNAYMKGNDSLVGRLAEKYPEFKAILDGVIEFVSRLWAGLKEVGAALAPLLPDFQDFADAVKLIFVGMGKAIELIFKSLAIVISTAIKGFKKAFEWAKGAYNWVTGRKEDIYSEDAEDAYNSALGKAKFEIESSKNTSFNPQAVSSYSQSRNFVESSPTVNIGDITINTQATDAQGVARDFTNYLNDEMRKTVNAFSSGVAI